MTTDPLIDKLLNKEYLTEDEIRRIIYYDFDDDRVRLVDEKEGKERQWTRDITTVFDIGGNLWAIDWDRGLTEYQDSAYNNQPYRVKRRTKTITIEEYVPLKEEKRD